MTNSIRAYVLNIRFDTMTQESGKETDWANLHFAGESRIQDKFVGSDVAKLRINPENSNATAKKLIALYGDQIPGHFDIECDLKVVQMQPQLICVGMKPVQ